MSTSVRVTAEQLLKGALYALEQCGILLRDALLLYRTKSYSSAVALAMIGREELGKYRILVDEWKKAVETGKLPSVDAIQKACEDHFEKQRQAQLSVTLMTEGGGALDEAMRAQIKHHPHSFEYKEARKVIDQAVRSIAKRSPEERLQARSRGLYVDLDDSGTEWSRPSQITQAEAKRLLQDAVNDYAGQHEKSNISLQRGLGNTDLASVLEAWPERPELPLPAWPE